jgi:uncharacterized protein YjbI with pentapeptide repeats
VVAEVAEKPNERSLRWRRWWPILISLAGVLMLVYIVAAIFVLPTWIVSQVSPQYALPSQSPSGVQPLQPVDRLKAITDTRGTLLNVLIPLAAAIAGTAAWFGLRATQAQLAETRRQNERMFETTQAQLKLSLQDQVNERFSKAIDQLGNDKLDVRIGGIYALGQIARDSAELHQQIMEILAAFLRVHTHDSPRTPSTSKDVGVDEAAGTEVKPAFSQLNLRADFQAAATVLGRRDGSLDAEKVVLDLRLVDLASVDLRGANLRGARLRQANLEGARLENANLEEAGLFRANLQRARLTDALLHRAILYEADLRRAALSGANLRGAGLTRAKLQEAILQRAILQHADLVGASLEGADLSHARLEGANFKDARLEGADFSYAQLNGASLHGVDLALTQGLTREQLALAKTDETTRLPDYPATNH